MINNTATVINTTVAVMGKFQILTFILHTGQSKLESNFLPKL